MAQAFVAGIPTLRVGELVDHVVRNFQALQ